jgi:hypothetical protein
MRSINNRLAPENRLTEELLKKEFDSWLPDLTGKLDEIAKNSESETQTGYPWLYTSEDLAVLNLRSDCKCVWWITPDLFKHALNPRSKDSIKTHLQRGTHYSFIAPASDETDTAAELLRRLAAQPDALDINAIPRDDFSKVAVTDYVILDPDSESLQAFLELPIDTTGYWIKAEYSAAMSLSNDFKHWREKKSRLRHRQRSRFLDTTLFSALKRQPNFPMTRRIAHRGVGRREYRRETTMSLAFDSALPSSRGLPAKAECAGR